MSRHTEVTARIKRPRAPTFELRPQADGRGFDITSTRPAIGTGTLNTADLPLSKAVDFAMRYGKCLANFSGCEVKMIDSNGQIFQTHRPDDYFRKELATWLDTVNCFSSTDNKLGFIEAMPEIFRDSGKLLREPDAFDRAGPGDVVFTTSGVAASPAVGPTTRAAKE